MVSDPRGVGPTSDRSWWLLQHGKSKRKKKSRQQESDSAHSTPAADTEPAPDQEDNPGDSSVGRVIDLEA